MTREAIREPRGRWRFMGPRRISLCGLAMEPRLGHYGRGYMPPPQSFLGGSYEFVNRRGLWSGFVGWSGLWSRFRYRSGFWSGLMGWSRLWNGLTPRADYGVDSGAVSWAGAIIGL